MKPVDWIVVGGGITGAALGYELVKQGFSVLLLEQHGVLQGASRYSYGGIAYWSATTALTRQICQEGIERYRTLSAELDSDIQFRELDLLLTIAPDADPEAIAATYKSCVIPPTLISVDDACALEPLLNPRAIAAALHGHHGHVDPERTTSGYIQAMLRLGGRIKTTQVVGVMQSGHRVHGVITSNETYAAANVVVAAGGLSRKLLQSVGVSVRCYFTQAELVETPPVAARLHTLLMPAALKRFSMETAAGTAAVGALWDAPGHEIVPAILDVGIVQLVDGRLRMGQISRVLTDPNPDVNAAHSEAEIRCGIGQLLPTLQATPGQWHQCLVAFSGDRLPLIGALPDLDGIYIFSGFSNPFAVLPALAQRFASCLAGQTDDVISQLSPKRFYEGLQIH